MYEEQASLEQKNQELVVSAFICAAYGSISSAARTRSEARAKRNREL